jgi:Coenzyme PQQ synthesis protein D (PqqD)
VSENLPVRNPKLAWREIEGEIVIISPENSQVHELNETAALIWKQADGKSDAEQIAAHLAKEFDVTPEAAREIVIQVVWTIVPAGNHVQTLAFSIPGGGLYQQTQTAFLVDGCAPGSVTLKRILPVAATWIQQRSITGPWTVEAVLDGQPVTSQALEMNP